MPWSESPLHPSMEDLETYISYLSNIIQEHKFTIYYSSNFRANNGIEVINVLIPGLERFNIIMSGNVVLPSERGVKILNNSQ